MLLIIIIIASSSSSSSSSTGSIKLLHNSECPKKKIKHFNNIRGHVAPSPTHPSSP